MLEKISKNPINQPTSEQIATLNALLNESEFTTKQFNNVMLTSSFVFIYAVMRGLFHPLEKLKTALSTQYGFSADQNDFISPFDIAFYFLEISVMFYLCHKISQSIMLVLPDVGQYQAREMQHKLGTKEEVARLITDLQKLIWSQNKKIFYPLGISFLLSWVRTFNNTFGTKILNSTFNDAGAATAPIFALSVFSPYFYNMWSNHNLTEQIKHFERKIQTISCLPKSSWKIVNSAADTKKAVLMCLELNDDNIKFIDLKKNERTISQENYFIELHRLLLEEKIPVYLASENKIFIGFFELDARNTHRVQEKFFNRLRIIQKHEDDSYSILTKLNKISFKITSQKNPWDYYFIFDEKNNMEINYCLNKNLIRKEYVDVYLDALKKAISQDKIKIDNEIVTLTGIRENKLKRILIDIKPSTNRPISHYEIEEDIIVQDAPVQQKTTQTKKQKTEPTTIQNTDDKSLEIPKKLSYPDKIDFGQNICFFKNPPEKKPDNFAYPMRIPWLSEGRAYGSIDPRVFLAVATYLTKDQVLNPLENGEVHGSNKLHNTKAGAVGIQNSRDPYQSVDGQNHERSHFKLKYSNNIRIFGHNAGYGTDNDGKQYLHYRFDGPGFGH